MPVFVNSGAYHSFRELVKAASASSTKYAPFPILSPDAPTCHRWRRELLALACIQEITVGKKKYFKPSVDIDYVKEKVSKKKATLLLPNQTSPQSTQTSFVPFSQPVEQKQPEKHNNTIISLTSGAYQSFMALYKNIKKSHAKTLPFPRLTNNRSSIIRWREELLQKKCIKVVEVSNDRRQYICIVEPYQVAPSGETRGARRNEIMGDVLSDESTAQEKVVDTKTMQVDTQPIRHEHPISRGRHLPNGHCLIEFVNAVQRELHVLKADRMKKIGEQIANLKIELTNTEDTEYERLYMKQLQSLVDARSQLNDQALIDAIKYVEAKKEFSEYQWSNVLVSIRPEDYVNRTIE